MDATQEIYLIADELRSIADIGLHYAENDYDRERYSRTLALSARLVAALEERSADEVMEEYEGNLPHATPYVAADAAVFRDGRILLIKREDNGLWAMPGGATEVGETWAYSAERELHEEAGVEGTATQLLGVFDSCLWGSRAKYHVYSSVWLVEVSDDQTPVAGPETTDVGFFAEDDLPDLSPGHTSRIPVVFKLARGELPVPFFDPTGSASKFDS
ncbi:MAG: NUDIX domain-containing protein [Dehalococcoidia bacterium]|nr:NUDIX domain-containing protein [Dehalococcoidia bacterium]